MIRYLGETQGCRYDTYSWYRGDLYYRPNSNEKGPYSMSCGCSVWGFQNWHTDVHVPSPSNLVPKEQGEERPKQTPDFVNCSVERLHCWSWCVPNIVGVQVRENPEELGRRYNARHLGRLVSDLFVVLSGVYQPLPDHIRIVEILAREHLVSRVQLRPSDVAYLLSPYRWLQILGRLLNVPYNVELHLLGLREFLPKARLFQLGRRDWRRRTWGCTEGGKFPEITDESSYTPCPSPPLSRNRGPAEKDGKSGVMAICDDRRSSRSQIRVESIWFARILSITLLREKMFGSYDCAVAGLEQIQWRWEARVVLIRLIEVEHCRGHTTPPTVRS